MLKERHLTVHESKFYETAIGKFVLATATMVVGGLILAAIMFVLSSAQPLACKDQNTEIKQTIIGTNKRIDDTNKNVQDLTKIIEKIVEAQRRKEYADSIKERRNTKMLKALCAKNGIITYDE